MSNLEMLKDKHERIVEIVRKWGDVNSDAILDRNCMIFTVPGIEGLIGYRVESGSAIVFGDPVCASENKYIMAQTFHEVCRQQDLQVIYAMAPLDFAKMAMGSLCHVSIEYGEKMDFNPQQNPMNNTGSKAILVRKKVKRALNEGVSIHEYKGNDPQLEKEIEIVAETWVKRRHGPQIYLSHPTLFADRVGKRWFYAQHQGRVVGLVVLNELKSKNGWFLNNLMLLQEAPQGSSELLVISTIQAVEKEGCTFVTCGPIPSGKLGKIEGMNKLSAMFTHLSFNIAKKLFHFEGYSVFWEKFQFQTEPSYILFEETSISMRTLRGLLRSLNASLR